MRATPHAYGFYALFSLVTWNLRGGMARYLTRDPMIVHDVAWAPDGQTIYISARNASITEQLYAISPRDRTVRQLTHGIAHHHMPVVSPDGRWLACVVEEPDRLPEVWAIASDGSSARPVSQANRRLDGIEGLHRLETAPVRWHSVGGLELEGLLFYPPGHGPDRLPPGPLPTIVDIRGGPVDTTPWRALGQGALGFTGLHFLAEHGYLCFTATYRHTGTYGWQHLQRIIDSGEHVGLDAADILSGVDHLVVTRLADPARLGVRGYSYGAYLTNWLVTQTSRFRAAVSAEGMTDLLAFPFPNTIAEVNYGGAPDQVPERYRRQSPITYAPQARTPLLLFEGEYSLMPKTRQGARFCDALVAAGVEVEYVQYPGEGHGLSRRNQPDYLRRMLAWYDRHLRR
jgi:dipeptidyl aminopeptidase/acylaminoacyl peptidase